MPNDEQIQNALRMLESAQAAIKSAKELLQDLPLTGKMEALETKHYEEGDQQIVEGVFDGQHMIGPQGKTYPVPPNYASKSKLVEGDRLKLTIMPNGSLLYKQISPADRLFLKGTLINDNGHFKVVTDEKTYNVLLASVTYYKGEAGDEVTLIVPNTKSANWGAIEAVLPKL